MNELLICSGAHFGQGRLVVGETFHRTNGIGEVVSRPLFARAVEILRESQELQRLRLVGCEVLEGAEAIDLRLERGGILVRIGGHDAVVHRPVVKARRVRCGGRKNGAKQKREDSKERAGEGHGNWDSREP